MGVHADCTGACKGKPGTSICNSCIDAFDAAVDKEQGKCDCPRLTGRVVIVGAGTPPAILDCLREVGLDYGSQDSTVMATVRDGKVLKVQPILPGRIATIIEEAAAQLRALNFTPNYFAAAPSTARAHKARKRAANAVKRLWKRKK